MICVEGLEDYRIADVICDLQRALNSSCDVAFWNGKADVLENALGVVLVLRDLDADGARLVGECCLDAVEIAAEPELNERVVVEAPYGYAAASCFFDDRAC